MNFFDGIVRQQCYSSLQKRPILATCIKLPVRIAFACNFFLLFIYFRWDFLRFCKHEYGSCMIHFRNLGLLVTRTNTCVQFFCSRGEAKNFVQRITFYETCLQIKSMVIVPTCIIHRVSLINNIYCFKCKQMLSHKDYVKCYVNTCEICSKYIYTYPYVCSDCWHCHKCNRKTRLPGFCKWCGIIYKVSSLKSNSSSKIFAYLLSSSHEFIVKNENKLVEHELIKIILEYL